jgi:RNA polymerase sigma factor (sigma-70 family)
MHERTRNKWPGPDEKQVVTQMLTDPYCDHWSECHHFFERLIQVSRLPEDMREDVAQNAVLSVINNLSAFRFDCKFSTWLVYVARSRITDARRDLARANKQTSIPSEPLDDEGNEISAFVFQEPHTPEEMCILHENLAEVVSALREYLSQHANPERNRQILQKYFWEQYTVEEIARELGVNAPVVRYTITSFKSHLKRSGEQDPPSETIS